MVEEAVEPPELVPLRGVRRRRRESGDARAFGEAPDHCQRWLVSAHCPDAGGAVGGDGLNVWSELVGAVTGRSPLPGTTGRQIYLSRARSGRIGRNRCL